MVSNSISSKMAPFVWKFIEQLQQKSEHIGTCAGVFKIQSELSGSGPSHPCDRFVIAFPYGAQCCKWEVLFDSNMPEEPPDFIFLNNDQNFLPDYGKLKGLHDWNHENPDSLVNSLRELIALYKLHHMKLIEGTRVEFELFSLTRCDEGPSDLVPGVNAGAGDHKDCMHFPDSEVFVSMKSSGGLGPIQIGVKLPIDFSGLSNAHPNDHEIDKVLAIVTYENGDGGNISTRICPSPRVERVLKIMGGIPHKPFPLEGCLHDYVVSITNQINDMVTRFSKSFERKKQFVQSVTSAFSSFLLEYDAITFSRVHMLVSTETSSTLLLTIEVPQNFPAVQPTLQFSSTSKESSSKVVKDFPYSPRWSSEEMTSRLKAYLLENVPNISEELGNSTKPKAIPPKT